MFPGTALGVLFGDVVYTRDGDSARAPHGPRRRHRDAARPRRAVDDRHGAHGARPGVPRREGEDARRTTPRSLAWQVGMATMVLMGVFKLIMSFFGDARAARDSRGGPPRLHRRRRHRAARHVAARRDLRRADRRHDGARRDHLRARRRRSGCRSRAPEVLVERRRRRGAVLRTRRAWVSSCIPSRRRRRASRSACRCRR